MTVRPRVTAQNPFSYTMNIRYIIELKFDTIHYYTVTFFFYYVLCICSLQNFIN